MPEQNQEPEVVVETPEPQDEVQTPEPTPVEIEAMEHGWRPETEFKADTKNEGKKWRSAEDFMDRKSFFDKIDAISTENKSLKKGMQALGQHYTKVEKVAFQRALDQLKAERKEALENQDLVKAEEIRDQMDEVKEKIASVTSPVQTDEAPAAEFVQWKEKNKWYKSDAKMTRYADAVGRELQAEGASPEAILKGVEREVKEAFPEKFRNPNRETAPELVPSGGRKAGNDGAKGFRLNAEQEKILNNMIRGGAPITREQYIADLKKQGE